MTTKLTKLDLFFPLTLPLAIAVMYYRSLRMLWVVVKKEEEKICGNCGLVMDKVSNEGWCSDCEEAEAFGMEYGRHD